MNLDKQTISKPLTAKDAAATAAEHQQTNLTAGTALDAEAATKQALTPIQAASIIHASPARRPPLGRADQAQQQREQTVEH